MCTYMWKWVQEVMLVKNRKRYASFSVVALNFVMSFVIL